MSNNLSDTTTNSGDSDFKKDEIQELLESTEKINNEIDETNREAEDKMKSIEAEVNESGEKLEKIFSELDQADQEASDEIDKLILEDVDELSQEEDSEL